MGDELVDRWQDLATMAIQQPATDNNALFVQLDKCCCRLAFGMRRGDLVDLV